MKFQIGKLGLCSAIACLMLLFASTALGEEPFCEAPVENPDCDVVTFENQAVGAVGSPWFQNGFKFTGDMAIYDEDILGHSMFWSCEGLTIDLPEERTYVTFTYVGLPAAIEFQAIGTSGAVVDTEVHENDLFDPQGGQAQSVTLWGLEDPIETVQLNYVFGAEQCKINCTEANEPMIGEVRACDPTW